MNVFTYGSLMFPEVWQRVVRGNYASRKAYVSGMRRFAVKDELYPAVVEGKVEDRVDGVLYGGLNESDLMLLDVFEGDQYVRQTVTVTLEGGETAQAEVYVFKAQFRNLLEGRDWDAGQFGLQYLQEFIQREKDNFDLSRID